MLPRNKPSKYYYYCVNKDSSKIEIERKHFNIPCRVLAEAHLGDYSQYVLELRNGFAYAHVFEGETKFFEVYSAKEFQKLVKFLKGLGDEKLLKSLCLEEIEFEDKEEYKTRVEDSCGTPFSYQFSKKEDSNEEEEVSNEIYGDEHGK